MAAAYLIARNFRSLGRRDAARWALIIGILFTLALVTTVALLPESVIEKIPYHVIPLAYGIIGYWVVKSLQQKDIDAHLPTGARKGSWVTIVGSGVLSLVLTLAYFWILLFLTPSRDQIFAGTPRKFESTGGTVYYDKATIQEADVNAVGTQLEKMGYFEKGNPLAAGFRKEGNKYIVELILNEEKWEDPGIQHDVQQFLRILKRYYNDREFQVRFVAFDSIGRRKTKLFRPKADTVPEKS